MGSSLSTQQSQLDKHSLEAELLSKLRTMQLNQRESSQDGEGPPITSEKSPSSSALTSHTPTALPLPDLRVWQTALLSSARNRLAVAALTKGSPRDVLLSVPTRLRDVHDAFSVRIPLEGGPMTNQRASGRCWLFASTNVFRVALMRKYGLAEFELSQAYLFFWDKLEKSNWFLEQVVQTAARGEPEEGRLVQRLLAEPVSDGGQWDMVANLVGKYGLVPKGVYEDSWSAANSGVLNGIVVSLLRRFAIELRGMVAEGAGEARERRLRDRKAEMVREVFKVLTLTLGPPPSPEEEFEWEFVDREGRARKVSMTPREFARDLEEGKKGTKGQVAITREGIDGMLSLVHDPRHEKLRLLSVDRLGNIVGGRGVRYVNVGMETLKAACVKQLEAGIPVFFGCDVGKFSDSNAGVMDLDLFDYEAGFGVSLLERGEDKKAERLRSGESQMTHAMVLTGVHVEHGKTVRWRVQNSWGEDRGDKGWFVMSDAWMDEFTYQAVIDPRFVDREVKEVLKQDPIVLPLWDPMGSLA